MNKYDRWDIVGIVVATLTFIAGYLYCFGVIASIMWKWFIVPLGVMSISVPMAIGIGLTIRMLVFLGGQDSQDEDISAERFLEFAIRQFFMLFGIFGMATVAHLFL